MKKLVAAQQLVANQPKSRGQLLKEQEDEFKELAVYTALFAAGVFGLLFWPDISSRLLS